MIDLTPLEVRKKKGDFRRIMRGYDPATVDDFIDLVADRLEELVREKMTLSERLAKQDHQVAEYRERERALTDALVSAQEMREEVRRQTTQDAEAARQASEQETAHLRRTVEEETARLRASAEQEAEQVRGAAQREADAVRAAARQEAERTLSNVRHERERTEEALRRVQSMQRQLVDNYRALLDRELSDLDQIEQGVAAIAAEVAAALPGSIGAPVDEPAAAAGEDAGFDVGASLDAAPAETEPFEPFELEPFEPEPFLPDDGTVLAPGGDPLGAAALSPDAETAEAEAEADARDNMLELDTEDEDLAAEAIESLGDILGSLGLDPSAGADEPPTAVDAGGELELYDGVAPDNPDDGMPGPIGLPGISLLDEGAEIDLTRQHEPRPTADGVHDGFSHERGVIPVTPPPAVIEPVDVFGLGDDDVVDEAVLDEAGIDGVDVDGVDVDDEDDADDDTARLLRNAAAAGYSLPEEDELLLSDAIDDEGGSDDDEDDPWLLNLLEEEDR